MQIICTGLSYSIIDRETGQNLHLPTHCPIAIIVIIHTTKELAYGAVFKLKQRNTNIKTELIAGMTTFFAMVYILMVNANMFADPFDGAAKQPPALCGRRLFFAYAKEKTSR